MESIKSTKKLTQTGVCIFDLSNDGARLKLVAFGSRSCNINEKNFRSFTEKQSVSGEQLVRIVISYGVRIFGGCVTAQQWQRS